MRSSWLAIALTGMVALCVQSWLRRLVRALGIAIASVALLSLTTSCSVQRQALRSEVSSQTSSVTRDTVREEVVVAVHDTLREVTTIIIQQNEAGDTVKQSVVTDRYRGRNAEAAKVDFPLRAVELNLHDERLTVQRDSIYVEKRDSSLQVTAYGLQEDGTPTISSKLSAVSKVLKWIFWILIGLIGLIITMKVCSLRR